MIRGGKGRGFRQGQGGLSGRGRGGTEHRVAMASDRDGPAGCLVETGQWLGRAQPAFPHPARPAPQDRQGGEAPVLGVGPLLI